MIMTLMFIIETLPSVIEDIDFLLLWAFLKNQTIFIEYYKISILMLIIKPCVNMKLCWMDTYKNLFINI